jgi:hypothetical protein
MTIADVPLLMTIVPLEACGFDLLPYHTILPW